MGRKPVGPRQYLLLHLAAGLIALFLASGCQHFQTEGSSTEHLLDQAETCRRQLDFACAERWLTSLRHPETTPADPRVIYLAGLVAVDARNPEQDFHKDCECFQQLVRDHAESPLAAEAVVWLGLMGEMHTQAETLERLQTANTRLEQEIEDHKAHLSRMEKRLERLKAVDLSLE